MNSEVIESATDQIDIQIDIPLQSEADSSENENHLCPRQSTEDQNESKSSQISVDNKIKSETKIYTECEVNTSVMSPPAGPFADNAIRNGFIRKVYSILFFQIAFTTIVSAIMFTFFRDYFNFQRIQERGDGFNSFVVILLLIIATITHIIITIVFCCSQTVRRTVPINFILLGIFTLAFAYIVGLVCAQHNGENVIIALIITGVVVLSITLLATTPYFDITNCGCVLCILLIIHCTIGGILFIVVLTLDINVKPLYFALSIFGAFLFSLYLLYDTQLILGGKKYQMSPEEYVMGAICLYIDIMRLFLEILRAVAIARD